ncbi:MAG: transposase, partial [Chloroflexi bacterium]|nr:transposase [Chloroflexota bacterium]
LGLTRLLTLGVRLSTWIELQVRRGLAQAGVVLSGLYQGQPKRTEQRPTAVRLLQAFTRAQITLTRIQLGAQQVWHLTPLPDHLLPILTYLGLPVSLYLNLTENSP